MVDLIDVKLSSPMSCALRRAGCGNVSPEYDVLPPTTTTDLASSSGAPIASPLRPAPSPLALFLMGQCKLLLTAAGTPFRLQRIRFDSTGDYFGVHRLQP